MLPLPLYPARFPERTGSTCKTYMDIMLNQNGDIASNSDDMVVEIDEILAD